jgi:hypothetical protein
LQEAPIAPLCRAARFECKSGQERDWTRRSGAVPAFAMCRHEDVLHHVLDVSLARAQSIKKRSDELRIAAKKRCAADG